MVETGIHKKKNSQRRQNSPSSEPRPSSPGTSHAAPLGSRGRCQTATCPVPSTRISRGAFPPTSGYGRERDNDRDRLVDRRGVRLRDRDHRGGTILQALERAHCRRTNDGLGGSVTGVAIVVTDQGRADELGLCTSPPKSPGAAPERETDGAVPSLWKVSSMTRPMFLNSSATIPRNSSTLCSILTTVGSVVDVVPAASGPVAAGTAGEGDGGR